MAATSPLAALRRLLARSARPIYVLDDSRTIVFANDALADWAGVELDVLVGLLCHYGDAGAESPRALGAGLCPPPEAWIAWGESSVGKSNSMRIAVQAPRDGKWRRRGGMSLAWSVGSRPDTVVVVLDERDLAGGEDDEEDPILRLHRQVSRLRHQLPTHATFHLLGDSPQMRRVRQQVAAASASTASVLVTGPPGVGCEEVAKAIYYGAPHQHGLLPLSCPLLDAELLAGALEDLQRSNRELGRSPTAILLLDVDELPPAAQASLYERLRQLEPPVWLLATASAPLEANESFHEELALHLSHLLIQLPPLEARPSDIPQLAQLVLQNHNSEGQTQLSGFEIDAMDLMLLYPWFENHRELERLVGEACRRAEGLRVKPGDLPDPLHAVMQQAAHPSRSPEPIDMPALLEDVERELIERAMKQARGNKAQAARLLGIQRSRLLRRLDALGLGEEAAGEGPGDDQQA